MNIKSIILSLVVALTMAGCAARGLQMPVGGSSPRYNFYGTVGVHQSSEYDENVEFHNQYENQKK